MGMNSLLQIPSKPRLAWPRLLAPRNTYTAREVRERLLMAAPDDPRTAAVHAAAARTGVWLSALSDSLALDLGRAASRLPTIVFWYSQGVPAREIGQRLSPFGSEWDAERALEVATTLIASVLNRGDLATLAA
jgi:hypothetical protein